MFGFGRKKKEKKNDSASGSGSSDGDQHGKYVHDGTAAASGTDGKGLPSGIIPPRRPGSMGVIRPAGTGNAITSDPGTDSIRYDTDNSDSGSVSMDEIPGILDEFGKKRQQRTISAVGELRNAAEPLIRELIQMGRDLENDDLNIDSIDKHLAIIVVRGKKQVINIIRRGVLELQTVETIEDAARVESALRQTLKKVGDVLGRQTRVIHIFAKKHANRLKENLAVMNKQHQKMRAILDRHNRADAESQEIILALDALRNIQEKRAKKSRRIEELSGEVRGLREQEGTAMSEIEKIKSSKDYHEYVKLLEGAKACDAQISEIRDAINSLFEKISRPLGRYEYGSSLDKEQQGILAGLVSDPASVMLPANSDTISEIISNVIRAVSSGSISVKDIEKTSALLGETADAVGPLADKAEEARARRRKISDSIKAAMPENLDTFESLLSKSVSTRKDNEERIASLRLEVKECNSEMSNMTSEIQIKLSQHTGTRYVVACDIPQ